VTPAAVSHQIKALETDLGALLFQRQHRAVALTVDGEALFQALAASFSKVSQVCHTIRSRRKSDMVTIGSTSSVATLWVSPSVIRFWRKFPTISVNQMVQDRPFPNTAELDLFVHYGPSDDPDIHQIELYRDSLVPLASPALARQLARAGLPRLAQQRLIHLDADDRSWTTWEEWFRQLKYDGPIAAGVHVNNYSVALQVATEGAGIALGWKRLVNPLLRSGQLAPVGRHQHPAPLSFYLCCRADAELNDASRKLRDWIVGDNRRGSG
jgi:DNA-binding transcriptional LysR family regulator